MLYATIREESKYYNQARFKGQAQIPFPITLDFENDPFWPVKGGIGGRYTLYDVDLWIMGETTMHRIPMHSLDDKVIRISQ